MNTSTNSSRPRRGIRRGLSVLVAASVVLAACGSDSDSGDATGDSTDAPTDTTGTVDSGPDSTDGDTFPVTIETTFGDAVIESEPQRVVSIGFAEHDSILALGVIPIAVRDWYGDQPYGTWPWAQDELGDAQPELLPSTELNFEQIAALDPDVIIGINSGITEQDYATLSAIAPTITRPPGAPDYGTPWRQQLEITGRALGRNDEAATVIEETEARFAAVREAHPEFEGATAAVAFTFDELPGAYASADSRAQVLTEMGFVTPPEFDELAGDAFYFTVSQEELDVLDTDVIVWVVSDETGYQALAAMPLRPSLNAYAEGREVIADPLLSGAFSHGSPLSLEFVIEELVPELALAVDGDPQTKVPSMALMTGEATAAGDFDEDEQAAADAWALVFDSSVGFDDKAPHLEDADALADTIAAYETAGAAMGGITLEPTAIVIDGDAATVTYNVNFGSNTAYTALEGTMTLVDGVWVVSRDEFCSFMASARNACPA